MTTFTLPELVKTVREIAAENPDKVYEAPNALGMCLYMHGDEPGCIFGHALLRLGVPPEAIGGVRGNIRTVLFDRGVISSPFGSDRLVVWCRAVQHLQDNRIPWGEAVNCADDEQEDRHE